MSGTIQSVFIPCEVLRVKALVAPAKSVLPLEVLVLEAISKRTRAPTLQELTEMFGIGARPMLDLIRPLWYTGALTVSQDDGQIQLTRATQTKLARGLVADVIDSTWTDEPVTVLRDLLTGHILRSTRFAGQRAGFTVPEELTPSRGRLSPSEYADLIDVVKSVVRRTFAGREKSLVDAIPETLGPMESPERTVVHIRALVSRDPDTDALRFTVLDPRRIPARVRADLGARLTRSAAANSDLLVYKNIRRRTPAESAAVVDPLDLAVERLRELCAELGHVPAEHVASIDAECVAAAEDVRDQLQAATGPAERVRVVPGDSGFREAVRNAICTARRQVVLTCPFGTWRGYAEFKDDLATAIRERDIRVVFVWGVGSDESFVRGTMQLAATPGARAGSVRRSTQAARVHAKVVVRDGDLAVVGSTNFLGDPSSAAQMGVVVESATRGTPCRTAVELLKWAKECIPEFAVRHSVDVPDLPPPPPDRLPDLPRLRVLFGEQPDAAADGAARAAWRRAWAHFLARVTALAGETKHDCRVVYDAEHRHHLLRVIRTARWRLLIASDRLNDGAFDATVERELRARLEADVPTALVWRRSNDLVRTGALAGRLEALAKEFPSTLWLVDAGGNHAKIVVADDEALVSSFNFLSFDGEYGGVRGTRLSREVGVHLKTPDATDAVVAALAGQLESRLAAWQATCFRPLPDEPIGAPETAVPETAASLAAPETEAAPVGRSTPVDDVGRLLDALQIDGMADDARFGVVRAFFAKARHPAETLEALIERRALCEEDLHHAVLCTLWRTDARAHPAYPTWVRTAAMRLWRARQFFDAAAMLLAVGERADGEAPSDVVSDVPSDRVALLAAVSGEASAFGRRLGELAASATSTAEDIDAACAFGVHALCSRGWDAVSDTLAAVRDPAGTLGQRLADAVLATWWEQTAAPLPLALIDQLCQDQQHAADRDGLREALDVAMQLGAKPTRFGTFAPGDRTLQLIFGPDGVLAPLLRAATVDDPTGLPAFLATIEGPEDIVMSAWRQVRDRAQRLDGPPRATIIRLTTNAVKAAQAWAASARVPQQALSGHQRAAVEALHARLRPLWPELTARRDAAEPRASAGVPFSMCCDLLDGVMRLSHAP